MKKDNNEQARATEIRQLIIDQLNKVKQQIANLTDESYKVEQGYAGNTRMNLMEADDRVETNAAIQQQRQQLGTSLEMTKILKRKERNLTSLLDSPYFGKLTIKEDGEIEDIYIGSGSLRDENENFLIYDWRSPIASLFYNSSLGPASYKAKKNDFPCEIISKRQFVIHDGQIQKMFDTSETINDEILMSTLSQENASSMRNIVTTIQQQQNQIIRDTTSRTMVVYGVAGSGKTSTILQRIAYLLFHRQNNLSSQEILLFSPNELFSNYIASVLPSLGEESMTQVTLNQFLQFRLTGLHVQTSFEKYEQNQLNNSPSFKLIQDFKQSLAAKDALLDYVAHLKTLKFNPLKIQTHVLFTAAEIADIFAQSSNKLPIKFRFEETVTRLLKRSQDKLSSLIDSQWFSLEFNNLSETTLLQLQIQADKQEITPQQAYGNLLLTQVKQAIADFAFFSEYEQYVDFISQLNFPELDPAIYQSSIQALKNNFETHRILQPDAVLALYLRDLITDGGTNSIIKELVIDEFQDYTPMQLSYFKFVFRQANFTLLGDPHQDVLLNHTLADNQLESIFSDQKLSEYHLNQAYRSTYQIIDFARQILPGTEIVPFNRLGRKPRIVHDLLNDPLSIIKIADQLLQKNKTVAIITPDQQSADQLYARLKYEPTHLLSTTDISVPEGVVILPIYLAKGLEFDAVIGYNINESSVTANPDYLYTLATRAMHDLVIHQTSEQHEILDSIATKYYE